MEIAQRSAGGRARSVLVTRLAGTDLAVGATPKVKLDNIVGGEFQDATGQYGHIVALRIRFIASITAVAATTGAAMPGTLLRALLKAFHLRWCGLELFDATDLDGEDLNDAANLIARAQLADDPTDIADAANATADTSDVEIVIPLSSMWRDFYGREDDHGLAIAGFDTRRDPQAGLKFTNASTGDLCKGFLGVTMAAGGFSAIEIRAVVHFQDEMNVVPFHLKQSDIALKSYILDPACGDAAGTHVLATIRDAPSTSTGLRAHTGYSAITVRAGSDQFLSEASVGDCADAMNQVDPVNPPAGQKLPRTCTKHMPLLAVRADCGILEQPRGPMAVKYTTSNTAHVLQAGRGVTSKKIADQLNATFGGQFERVDSPMKTFDPVRAQRIAQTGVQKLFAAKK